MSKLNKNALRWVKALESGEYEQGVGHLGSPTGKFCCLGVACEEFIKAGGELIKIESASQNTYKKIFIYGELGEGYCLPWEVKHWLGINTACASYRSEDAGFDLMDENDSGKSFKEIAKIIRSKPKGLFVD